METAGLSLVLNHRIAASKGVSEGDVECDLINWPLGSWE